MAKSTVFPAKAFEIGGGRIVPSPNQFYLTGEDRLRVVSVNSAAAVRITIACRTANPQGDTVAQSFTHVPATDRSKRTEEFNIGDGSLLNVTVFASAGTPRMGATYVIVQLVRGAGAAAVVLGTVLAGGVTTTQALGFPGSPITSSLEVEPVVRVVNGTQPAVGTGFSETCPTGARWELQQVFANYTASGAAASRFPEFRVFQDGIIVTLVSSARDVIAAETANFMWAPNLPVLAPGGNDTRQQPIPDRTVLNAGDFFLAHTPTMQAGDQWTAPHFVVREWLEVM